MSIREKLDNETKAVCSMIDQIEDGLKVAFANLENADTHEMYEVADIYKDLSEVKKNLIKSCYYMQILEAMEESEYGEDYDANGPKRYYSRPNSIWHDDMIEDYRHFNRDRDIDRLGKGRMYFTEPNSEKMRDGREGQSGISRKHFMESKELHKSGSEADRMKNRQELEKWVDDISADVKSALGEMTSEERTVMKQKLANLSNAI